jgi:hypothetical protein
VRSAEFMSQYLDESDRYKPNFTDDDILFEMSNLKSKTTGLPNNIEIWVRADPEKEYGHNKYRVKIVKDNKYAGIYSVGAEPILRKDINNSITPAESFEIKEFLITYSTLLITHIDGIIDSPELENGIRKIRGSK